jgi:hypothetical protein
VRLAAQRNADLRASYGDGEHEESEAVGRCVG